MTLYLGTSGWNYKHWRQTFYPEGLPASRWLAYYFERFQTVELNASFYRQPSPEQFAKWREQVPEDFVFTVKINRYVTHIKRLRDVSESIQRFMEAATQLQERMGPILVQLPPNLKVDLGALEEALAAFDEGVRVAVEFRHDSWFTDEARQLLEKFGASWCLADRKAKPVTPVWRSSDWTFLRFHEGLASPHPCYGRASLQTWVERLTEMWGTTSDIYVYFNNDPRACALRDAIVFGRLARSAGFEVTRTPEMSDVHVPNEQGPGW